MQPSEILPFVRRVFARMTHRIGGLHPAKLALLGYISYTLLGWLLLCLPFMHRSGVKVGALDNLFIATSAMSTTGLATISITDSYNGVGQVVVLVLIQFGGIGYMTFGSFVILSTKGELSEAQSRVGRTVFSLPSSFRLDKFIRSVVIFSFVIEAIGAVALYFVFRESGTPDAAWSALFHSISSFCTAGFSLYNNSFEGFASDFWLNFIVSGLSILGAIGFIVLVDYSRRLTGKARQVTLTSKIIMASTFWLLAGGTLLVFLVEPTVASLPAEQRLLASFFQAMTAITTVGFNTVPIGALSKATLLLFMLLMVIGASPSGTGGGLKSTTASVLWGIMRGAIRGRGDVVYWRRPIPLPRVMTAVASLGFYMLLLLIGTFLLELTESGRFEQTLFEAASAIGTVGLSTGITPSLTVIGKLVVIMLMFCGRLGPLTFGMALFLADPRAESPDDNDLAV